MTRLLHQFASKLSQLNILATIALFLIGGLVGMSASAIATLPNGIRFIGLVIIGVCGLIFSFLLANLRYGVHYALVLVIISVTIHRESFDIPFEVDGVAVPVLAATVFFAAPRRFLQPRYYPLLIPIGGYLAANFAATFLNASVLSASLRQDAPILSLSVRQCLILTYRAATFFLVIMAIRHNPELRGRQPLYLLIVLLMHTLLSLAALSIYPIIQTPLVRYGQFGASSLAIMGFFLEPNLFGIFALSVVALTIPIALFSRARQRQRLLLGIIIGIIGIVLSYTRSAWLGLIVVIGCLTVFMMARPSARARSPYKVVMLVLGLILFCLLAALIVLNLLGVESALVNRFAGIVDIYSGSGSGEERIKIWGIALQEWQQHIWLGNGPLSFEPTTIASTEGWLYGSVMQTLHDSGIIGTFFMLCILAGCMSYTWRAYRVATADRDKGILLGYLLAQIALFFTSQFSSFFWGGFTWVLLGLAVGHSLIILKQHRDATKMLASP